MKTYRVEVETVIRHYVYLSAESAQHAMELAQAGMMGNADTSDTINIESKPIRIEAVGNER